jgi:hypothetical protein
MRLVFVRRGAVCLAAVLAWAGLDAAVSGQIRQSPVDLVQTQLNAPGKVKIGKKFRVMDEVESVGDQAAGPTLTYFYLSNDDAIDSTDLVIAQRRSPQLSPGRTSFEPTQVVLPATVEPGAYYLIARCNATRAVDERYWDNNTRAVKITVQPADQK